MSGNTVASSIVPIGESERVTMENLATLHEVPIGESERVTMENLATLHEVGGVVQEGAFEVGGVVQEGAFGLANVEENPDNSQYNVSDILAFLEQELLGPDKNFVEDPSKVEENAENSQYNVNDIFAFLEQELLGPDKNFAEDPSAAMQECPSIEGTLPTNPQINRGAETVSKKERKSPYRGVKQQRSGKWAAQIRDPSKGKTVWIGTFDSPLEAARAYDAEARRVRGKKAKLNFPDEAPPKKSKKTCKCAQYLERLTLPKKSGKTCKSENSPLESRSTETPPVLFHDQVQGMNSENFMSEFVGTPRTSSALSPTVVADWGNITGISEAIDNTIMGQAIMGNVAGQGISEAIHNTIMGDVAGQARMGNVAGHAIMDIPEGILQNGSPLIESNVMQPQTSHTTLKSNSVAEPGMDSFLASFQFPESTGHADTSGTSVPLPEQWDFDDDIW